MRNLAVLVLLGGCSVFAERSDYHAYREVRLASGDEERVRALREYLAAHPDGRWAPEVRTERERVDSRHWVASNESCEGLASYLELFPDGAHRSEASDLYRARRCGHPVSEDGREWVARVAGYWTAQLASIDGWGESMRVVDERNPDFVRLFARLGERPTCSAGQCVKPMSSPYFIPVPGAQRIDRRNVVYVRLLLDRERLIGAEILLADHGFSRWYEREQQTIITDEVAEDRDLASAWALDRVISVFPDSLRRVQPVELAPRAPTPFATCAAAPQAAVVEAPAVETPVEEAPAGESVLEELMRRATDPVPPVLPDPVSVVRTPAAPAVEAPPAVEPPVVLAGFEGAGLRLAVFRDAARCDESFDGIAFFPVSAGGPKSR
jgi:hypothetical protein